MVSSCSERYVHCSVPEPQCKINSKIDTINLPFNDYISEVLDIVVHKLFTPLSHELLVAG